MLKFSLQARDIHKKQKKPKGTKTLSDGICACRFVNQHVNLTSQFLQGITLKHKSEECEFQVPGRNQLFL